MIDLHSHLLHGVDDGAVNASDSVALLKMAIDDGITHIALTPHIQPGRYENTAASLKKPFEELEVLIDEHQLNISISLASEVRLCSDILDLLINKKLPFIGQWKGKNVILLEFPHSDIPLGSEKLVDWLLDMNILPMIAHPERNKIIMRDIKKIVPFLQRGCLLQLTAMSVTGKFGAHAYDIAHQLLINDWVSVIASDAHNINRRPPILSEAYDLVSEQYSTDMARKLFIDNPTKILCGHV